MIDNTKVISTDTNEQGTVTVKVLRAGSDDVRETEQITPFGFTGRPVKDRIAIYSKASTDGDDYIIGYLNLNSEIEVGESEMFSTDEQGNVVMAITLRNDGTAELGGDSDFLARFNELKAGFDELVSNFNTHLNNYNAHIHTAPSGATGPPSIFSNPSSASIDAAKIDNLKTS